MDFYMITCTDTTVLYEFGSSESNVRNFVESNYKNLSVARVDKIK